MTSRQFLLEQVPTFLPNLTADTSPQWGRMSAQHMLEHLFNVLTISRKEVGIPLATPEDKLPKIREWLWNDEPFWIGVEAVGVGKTLPALRFENLDAAKEAFLINQKKFYAFYDEDPSREMLHPLFGILDFAGWEAFHVKHVRHHFTQFSLLPTEWELVPKQRLEES